MKVVKKRKDSLQSPLSSQSYIGERIGLWASVVDVHSESNSVDVITDTGYRCINIPVISKEWICNDDDKDFISGTRSLPPKFSRVFILMPNKTMDGAFVLCSTYSKGDNGTHGLYAASEDEIETKNNIEEKVSLSGWNSKEYYEDGNRTFESKNGDISLKVVLADNDDESLEQGITLKVFDTEITINPDGLSFTDKNDNKVESTSNGLKVTDKNDNTITMASSGITIEDKNGNTITGSSSGWDLNGYLTIGKKKGGS